MAFCGLCFGSQLTFIYVTLVASCGLGYSTFCPAFVAFNFYLQLHIQCGLFVAFFLQLHIQCGLFVAFTFIGGFFSVDTVAPGGLRLHSLNLWLPLQASEFQV